MKNTVRFALLSAALGLLSTSAAFAKVDCVKLALRVQHSVAANPSATLQIVEKEVALTPACACELVKAAIKGSKADVKLVAAIVETAATVAPEHRHLIGQCAVALAAVQAVLAKLDPQEKSKILAGAKNALPEAKAKPTSNPLDFPGSSIEAYLAANGSGSGNSEGNGGTGNSGNNSGGGGNNSGGGGNNSGGGSNGGGGGGGGSGGGGGGFIGGVPGGPGGGGFTPPPAAPPGGGTPGVIAPPDVTTVTP